MNPFRRHGFRSLLVAVGVAGAVLLSAAPASAHPLGNFTVNRYARIELTGEGVRVYYVLDEAEIPAFQDRGELAADREKFIATRAEEIRQGLTLEIGGTAVVLHAADTLLSQPSGQGGLPTLRLAIRFDAPLPSHTAGGSLRATFVDRNEPDRIGWREIVVEPAGDTTLLDSNVPARDVSDELRQYPASLIQAPLDLRRSSFGFVPGTTTPAPAPLTAAENAPSRPGGGFVGLVDRHDVTPIVLAGMLGAALLVGAGHSLAPGHGKTVMVAYLVGTKGRPIDAVLLGVIVSVMHTTSVLALALALYQLDRSASVEQIYPVLSIIAGVSVIAFGAYLLATRARRMRRSRVPEPHRHDHEPLVASRARGVPVLAFAHATSGGSSGIGHSHDDHTHAHDDHAHAHDDGPTTGVHSHARAGGPDHGHSHGHGHSHELPPDVAPLSRRGLALLATSGGLLPSPSAVLVLIAAFTAGRAALGLTLVAAFSVGLAVTLTGIGLALVVGGKVVEKRGGAGRRTQSLLRWAPVIGAAAIVVVGTVVATQGITKL